MGYLGGGPPRRTIPSDRTLLAVARTPSSLNRLVTVLPLVDSDSRVAVKFTIDEGSRFGHELDRLLGDLGAEVLPWSVAVETPVDLALAAHVDANLAQLAGPLMVLPHGAGYNRLVPTSTGNLPVAAGLSPAELMSNGKVFPDVIGLSHEEQLDRLGRSCPEAVPHAAVVGDPAFDRMLASEGRRERYRGLLGVRRGFCLVLLTSTWNAHSALGRHERLVHRLAAELPVDEYQIAVILHPNIWYGHSIYEIRAMFRDALDSGVLIIPPSTWEAALIAADVIIGDHGSVSVYGAALNRPFLQAADGLVELDPDSPVAEFAREAQPLDLAAGLREQIEFAVGGGARQLTAFTDRTLGRRGESWELLHDKLYELLRLEPKSAPARMLPVPDPTPERGNEITAFLTAAIVHRDGDAAGRVELRRYPAIVGDHRGPWDHADLFRVVDHREVEHAQRQSADIVFRADPLSRREAVTWTNEVLYDHPGAMLAAALTSTGCLLRQRDGRQLEAVSGDLAAPGVPLVASAVRMAGGPAPDHGPGSVGGPAGPGQY